MPTSDDYGGCLNMDSKTAGPFVVPGAGTGGYYRWIRPNRTHDGKF